MSEPLDWRARDCQTPAWPGGRRPKRNGPSPRAKSECQEGQGPKQLKAQTGFSLPRAGCMSMAFRSHKVLKKKTGMMKKQLRPVLLRRESGLQVNGI